MSWQFGLLLFAAFTASSLLTLVQHRAYQRTINRVAAEEHRPGVTLVTGTAKGRLRGAVAVLVIDSTTRHVTRCLVMAGGSVLARFRERPELTGPLREVANAATQAAVQRAVEDATSRFRRMTGDAATRPTPAPAVIRPVTTDGTAGP
ncbi:MULTISPECIES: transcriptional regulator GutM [Streptomyces]|uniref:transcriptional regulator GutM n=1 Tax=Streptomyces lycopersici TaxID=2974589 RepID=UPI0021CFC8F9|nr:transcriptional regulator GutM [Streptomyces sp. NEAU-383]